MGLSRGSLYALIGYYLALNGLNAFNYGYHSDEKLFVHITMLSIVLLLCIFNCWQRKRHVLRILRELLHLENRYLSAWEQSMTGKRKRKLMKLNNLYYIKLGLFLLTLIRTWLFYPLYLKRFRPKNYMLDITSTMLLVNVSVAIMFEYYCILWQICRSCSLLNDQLSQLLCPRSIRESWKSEKSAKFLLLKRQFFKILALHSLMGESFQYILLCLLASKGWYLITYGYEIFVIIAAPQHSSIPIKMRSFVIVSYLIDALNLYYTSNLAENLEIMIRKTAFILRTPPRESSAFKRLITAFALELAWRQKCASILNVFTINRQLTFKLLAKTLLYTICWLQGDYLELRK
ncbi:putative gustatory receptor 85a [Scaptodrosophila lebanonensis]|uniref:Gustatory receptor n=1 Tax=Drosophila lebanonensis TaxID=7225 RepID=A0A6J2T2M5_DROLE|nr:putative gustatory receptor 85a [Scaptodrosophila lebanonensis]